MKSSNIYLVQVNTLFRKHTARYGVCGVYASPTLSKSSIYPLSEYVSGNLAKKYKPIKLLTCQLISPPHLHLYFLSDERGKCPSKRRELVTRRVAEGYRAFNWMFICAGFLVVDVLINVPEVNSQTLSIKD